MVDPWAGSYMMEKLTQDMADAAWKIIEEVDAMGGMVKAVDSGWAKLKIERAAEKQARIDSGKDVIVGVNKAQTGQGGSDRDPLEVDNHAVRENQVRSRERACADQATRPRCEAALDALTGLRESGRATCST